MSRLHLALLLGLAPVLVPATADAATVYRASVTGTLTSTGTVVNAECLGPDPAADAPAAEPGRPREPSFEPQPEPQRVTRTGRADVTVRFRTVTPARIYVQRRSGGEYPAVALVGRPLRAVATVTQASDLLDRETPAGCLPEQEGPPRDCGMRTVRFGIGMGAEHGRGVAPDLSKVPGEPTFRQCPLTVGMAGFPRLTGGHGFAPVSAARLLAGRKLVLSGGRRGSDRIRTRTVTADGSYVLRYTVTLTPVRS